MKRRRILLVGRSSSRETAKAAQAIAALANVDVVTGDLSDVENLLETASKLRDTNGSVPGGLDLFDRIVTPQETLLEAVAVANETLGLPGLSVAAVRRTLDKSQLKETLEAAGLNTPRYKVVGNLADANGFVTTTSERKTETGEVMTRPAERETGTGEVMTRRAELAGQIGFPIVLKSLSGSGALATFLVNSEHALQKIFHESADTFLAEQYITGQELCVDTITIDNEPRFHSICCYQPSILEAIEHPETQWSCVMPREMEPYRNFIEQGLHAVRALKVGNAMTHMEGFIDATGKAWFTDATLRPAGARIAPMLAYAYDIDPYGVWARVAVDETFDGPWDRKYAAGTIFLRGLGAGTIQRVDGIEHVEQELKHLLVEVRWPRLNAQKSATYTGDGFVTVRHEDTEAVQTALRRIAELITITYSSDSQPATETWAHRLQNFRELNRPAWDQAN